jgi:ribonuclease P/MRP protein subunit POP8
MLTNSLMQYLGVVGSAIHIDILHSQDDEVWLRVPTADIVRFGAAVSGFVGTSEGRSVGFKTMGSAAFLMALIGKTREGDVWD